MNPGDCLELLVFDDAGKDQGTIIVGVLAMAGVHRGGYVVEAMFLAASDRPVLPVVDDGG